MGAASAVRVSIVLETDNVRVAGEEVANQGLRGICEQAADVGDAEVLVVTSDDADPDDLAQLLELDDDVASRIDVRLVKVPGGGYARLKDQGAREAEGEILVFADSDVLPEPGWLSALVEPFDDPDVEVVCGNTYVHPRETLFQKTQALTWIFPVRTDDRTELEPATHFYANNVAFRASTILRYGFTQDQRYRGQNHDVTAKLAEDDVTIWLQPRAHLRHVPLDPGRPYLLRGLWAGHDAYLNWTRRRPGTSHLPWSLWVLGSNIKRAVRRIVSEREAVSLPAAAVPLAVAIASSFYVAAWFGYLLTWRSPGYLERRFPI